MSSFSVKMMAGSLPLVTGSNPQGPPVASVQPPSLPLQVQVKKPQKLESHSKTSMNISRRDLALFLTAASFGAVTLTSPQPAEARISKSEMKKMILEKLKMLREKVGLSKPETEETDKNTAPSPPITEKETPASPAPSIEEEKIPAKETPPASPAPSIEEEKVPFPPKPPLPSIQNDKKIAVEAATLP